MAIHSMPRRLRRCIEMDGQVSMAGIERYYWVALDV